jgi:cytochrome c556
LQRDWNFTLLMFLAAQAQFLLASGLLLAGQLGGFGCASREAFAATMRAVAQHPLRSSEPVASQMKQLMKHQTLAIAFLSVAGFSVGCNKQDTTSQQIDKVQAKTEEAAHEMKDYTFAQKAEFTEKMHSQLAAINKDLDQLEAKIEKSSDAVKAEAKPKLQSLRDQAAKLNKHLDEAKNATESTWDSVKASSKKAYNELKDGFNNARQWVSDKIAP